MTQAIATPSNCCSQCGEPLVENIPGAQGPPGADGTNGANGLNAYTLTTAGFTMPAIGNTVAVAVLSSSWATISQMVYVGNGAGYMSVSAKTDTLHMTLLNPVGYAAVNAAGGTAIAIAAPVSPSGIKGADGTNGTDAAFPTTNKGDIMADDGGATPNDSVVRVAVGANGTRLKADSTASAGVSWAKVDVSAAAEVTGALAITNGGTGQATANPAFNALAPTTTQGDIIYRNATVNTRLGIGTALQQLRTNAGATAPEWFTPTTLSRYGLLGSLSGADMNSTADQTITLTTITSNCVIRRILVTNASVNLTTAAGGVYTGAAKTNAIVSAAQVYTALSAAAKYLDLTLTGTALTDRVTANIYLSLTTGQGAPATADVYVFGEKLD